MIRRNFAFATAAPKSVALRILSFDLSSFSFGAAAVRFCASSSVAVDVVPNPFDAAAAATSASAPAPSPLSLLQRYTQPGVLRRHPLELLSQVASEQLSQQQPRQRQQEDDDEDPDAVSVQSSAWSVEEIQVVTADAAKRLVKASRCVLDDDLDLGVKQAADSFQSGAAASSPATVDSLGASFLAGESEAMTAAFVEEQRHFDRLHATLFHGASATGAETISDKIEACLERRQSREQQRRQGDDVVESDNELSCCVLLLQRHILLARLCSRFDAAVEAFLLLVSVHDRGVDVVVDAKERRGSKFALRDSSSTSIVEVPVLSWRQLRDVFEASAAAAATSVGAVAAATTESNYATAETLLRLVMKKFSGDGAPAIERVINTPVMQSLARCIRNASDLRRFRELMAVECATTANDGATGGNGDAGDGGGALAHIPVSLPLYNELILACSRCNDEPQRVQVALALYRAVGDNGLVPTPATYAAMVATYAAEGQCNEAFAMFHEAKRNCDAAAVGSCPPLYNHLIEAYANAGKVYDAVATANVLLDAHAPLTRRGFHAALSCMAVQGDLSQIHDYLGTMQGKRRPTDGNDPSTSSSLTASALYNIPATPTTLAITLASLYFVRRSELSWREKLTVVGDTTSDALALLPVSASALPHEEEEEGDKQRSAKSSTEQKRLQLFCETEGFFCATLTRVLSSISAAPIFSAAAIPLPASVPVPSSSSSSDEPQQQEREWKDEAGLYRHHVNLPLRIVEHHCHLTLINLLERAVERRVAAFVDAISGATAAQQTMKNNNTLQERQRVLDLKRGERRKRAAEQLLEQARAGTLFAPQTPSRMPRFAEVAALMPDVLLDPAGVMSSASVGADVADLSAGATTAATNRAASAAAGLAEEADMNALVRLLQSVLPHVTVFFLPFASIRAIVAEADALLHFNDKPLLQRHMFADCAAMNASLVSTAVSVDGRNRAAVLRARIEGKMGSAKRRGLSAPMVEKMLGASSGRDDDASSGTSSMALTATTEAGSLSHLEREARLDRLADAVLALATFLRHHGDRVHVQSAASDLDVSRAAPMLHLDADSAVQCAAAAAIGMVLGAAAFFAPGPLWETHRKALLRRGERAGPAAASFNGSTYSLAEAARAHSKLRHRRRSSSSAAAAAPSASPVMCTFVDAVRRDSTLSRALAPPSSSSAEAEKTIVAADDASLVFSSPSLLYFRAQANVNLVTCDALLSRRWRHSRRQQQWEHNLATFRSTVEELQTFHRDAARMLLQSGNAAVQQQQSSGSRRPFESVSGLKLPSLATQQRQQQRQETQAPEERGFAVRIIDPSKVIVE